MLLTVMHCIISHVFHADTDECAERSDGCNHICENTVGNYSCSCFNDGYRMSDDQLTCLGTC